MGGIGDQLAATPVFRELKRRLPAENLRVYEPYHPELWKHNPYMNRGNHENGVRIHLDSPGAGERIAQHYAKKVQIALGWKEEFILEDDTPEIYLTDAERSVWYDVDKQRGVAINGDAGWKTRRWPYFKDLATELLARGYPVYHVGHDGSPALPCTKSFKNKLTLRQTAVLLSQCSRLVCNDTGLFHLAAAVGIPCTAIFGYIPATERAYKMTSCPGRGTQCLSRCNYTRCSKSFVGCQKLESIPMMEVYAAVTA